MQRRLKRHRLLIHCKLPQLREGLELHLEKLNSEVETKYADLSQDGIGSKLKFAPNLIIVLLNQSDEEMLLAIKLKMFAPNIKVLWITPAIPEKYYSLLQVIGITNIIQLPEDRNKIGETILGLLA